MHNLARLALAIVLISGCASWSSAGDLKLTLNNGRATLIAQDVPLRQILDEWARVGKTTIVNADKLSGPPMTLQLIDRPEREVLDLILRSASGYIAAQRDVSVPGASVFDKVMILAVSHGPVGVTNNAPSPFNNRQALPMQMPQQVPDDDVIEQPQVLPPGVIPPNGMPNPMMQPMPPGQQAPLTAPRPGMLPAPPAGQPNPYAQPPMPGAQPPGPAMQAPVPGAIRPPGGPGGETQ